VAVIGSVTATTMYLPGSTPSRTSGSHAVRSMASITPSELRVSSSPPTAQQRSGMCGTASIVPV
jgi:hypothetical protein